MERIDLLYRNRFSAEDRPRRHAMWKALCEGWFQRYVRESDTVLECACGLGEFISTIKAGRKIAFDVNPDVADAWWNSTSAGSRAATSGFTSKAILRPALMVEMNSPRPHAHSSTVSLSRT